MSILYLLNLFYSFMICDLTSLAIATLGKRAGCFLLIVFLFLVCLCYSLLGMCWSFICNSGSSWSYSLVYIS